MEGTTLRIENSSRAHAESLHLLLTDYKTELVQQLLVQELQKA